MRNRLVAWLILAAIAFSSTAAQAQTPHRAAPKVVAQAVDPQCSYYVPLAKSLGIPVCGIPPQEVADTIPGTAGNPSSQVITVQGCTGCISTGSGGGGGGGAVYSGVPANAYGQTGVASSFSGIAGFDYANSNIDALTVAPFGGNGGGTGYPASYGQPGVLVVQGGLQGGAIGVSGNLGGPYSGAANQTLTSASFFGLGGVDSASNSFYPFQTGIAGTTITAGHAGLYVQGIGTNGAMPVSGTVTQGGTWTVTANAGTGFPSITSAGTSGTSLTTIQGSSSGVAVPVSGTVTVNAGTGFAASGTTGAPSSADLNTQLDGVTGSGTITSGSGPTSYVTINTGGYATLSIQFTGTFSASGDFLGDTGAGTYPITIGCYDWVFNNYGTVWNAVTTKVCPVSGFSSIRVAATSYTSGTATVNWHLQQSGVGQQVLAPNGTGAAYVGYATNGQIVGGQIGLWTHSQQYAFGSGSAGQANAIGLQQCDQSVAINVSSAATTQLIAAVTNSQIYVCGYNFTIAGSASATAKLEYGTGTTCGTGTVALTGAYLGGTLAIPVNAGSGLGTVAQVPVSNALCIVGGGTTPSVQGMLYYTQH